MIQRKTFLTFLCGIALILLPFFKAEATSPRKKIPKGERIMIEFAEKADSCAIAGNMEDALEYIYSQSIYIPQK